MHSGPANPQVLGNPSQYALRASPEVRKLVDLAPHPNAEAKILQGVLKFSGKIAGHVFTVSERFPFMNPFNTVCLPLKHSGNPGVKWGVNGKRSG